MKLAHRARERSAPLLRQFEAFLKQWEWSWTRAVLVALVLWLIGIGFIAIIPSWWLYFAQQRLHWQPCPCPDALHFWLFKLRDVIAIILFSIPFALFIVVPLVLQRMRQRLRGEGGVIRPTGGYR